MRVFLLKTSYKSDWQEFILIEKYFIENKLKIMQYYKITVQS